MTTTTGTIIKRVVGETGRPITGTLASEDGALPTSLPTGSTITLYGTHQYTGVVVISGRAVTITDWATLAFAVTLLAADVATACTLRLRFKAIPAGGTDPDDVVDIPDDDAKYPLYLTITPF